MRRLKLKGIVHYRFAGAEGFEGLFHAVLTRIGGVSQAPYATLNLGHSVGDSPEAVKENHRRALLPLEVDPPDVVSACQVHRATVGVVGREDMGTVYPETDALVTATAGVPLLMRFGDCAPVILCDPVLRVAAMAHAGWRGIVAGVVEATVRTMTDGLGCRTANVWTGVGPTIGPCCYEVGADVAQRIAEACPTGANIVREENGRTYADLPGAVEAQLRAAGIQLIEQANLCTACHVDEFFSHRAERGHTGRFGVVLGWRP